MSFDATDGYSLYSQLQYGEPHTLRYGNQSFTLQFEGETVGHSSCLVVTDGSGSKRCYSPGFDHPAVFNALEEIELGWAVPQTHLPRFYQDHD